MGLSGGDPPNPPRLPRSHVRSVPHLRPQLTSPSFVLASLVARRYRDLSLQQVGSGYEPKRGYSTQLPPPHPSYRPASVFAPAVPHPHPYQTASVAPVPVPAALHQQYSAPPTVSCASSVGGENENPLRVADNSGSRSGNVSPVEGKAKKEEADLLLSLLGFGEGGRSRTASAASDSSVGSGAPNEKKRQRSPLLEENGQNLRASPPATAVAVAAAAAVAPLKIKREGSGGECGGMDQRVDLSPPPLLPH